MGEPRDFGDFRVMMRAIGASGSVDSRFLDPRFLSPDAVALMENSLAAHGVLARLRQAAERGEGYASFSDDASVRDGFSAAISHLPSVVIGGKTLLNAKLYSADDIRSLSPDDSDDDAYRYADREALARIMVRPQERGLNVLDLRLRANTIAACEGIAGYSVNRQEPGIARMIGRRVDYIESAHPYRFSDRMEQVFVEKHRNSAGEREMPFQNMWLECALVIDGHEIHGVSIVRCHSDRKGRQEYYDVPERSAGFDWDEVSIFFVGFDQRGEFFNSIMSLGTESVAFPPDEKLNCPFCDSSLHRIDKRFVSCVSDYCCSKRVGVPTFDLKDSYTKRRVMRYNSLGLVRAGVRNFVANVLDFIMYPDVVVRTSMSEERHRERNAERALKGKPALPLVRLIEFDGVTKRYIRLLTEKYESHHEARAAHWVQGHFFRFWSRKKWHALYKNIEDCLSDEEKQARISKLVRKDADGVPKKERYRWNARYEVIEVLKMAFIRGAGDVQDAVRSLKVRS